MTHHRELARIKSTSLGYEDHGILTGFLHVDYGGAGQGVGGYQLAGPAAAAFIKGCLKAGGVDAWEKLAGRTIYVLREDESRHSRILGIENLPTEPGGTFLFASMYEESTATSSPSSASRPEPCTSSSWTTWETSA